MSKQKRNQLAQKKEKLQKELSRLENQLDISIDGVKEEVTTNLKPKALIRKYPLPAVGISLVIGYLAGKERKQPSSKKDKKNSGLANSFIAKEVKNAISKKAIHLILDLLDQKVAELKKDNKSPREE